MKTFLATMVILVTAVSAMAIPSLQVQITTSMPTDYTATVVTGPVGIYNVGDSFRTFCLEKQEKTSNNIYGVVLSDTSYYGGVGPVGDPLDTKTAFLYSEFLNGNLAPLGFNNDSDSIDTLQNVIWGLEGEGVSFYRDPALAANLLAHAELADGSNYGIAVMVMYDAEGNRAQDMMVKVIPTPGAVVLGSIGVSLVGWLRRRRSA